MARSKAPPFKQRVEAALAAAKAAGSARLKITSPDGTSYEFDVKPEADPELINPFDLPPNPIPSKRKTYT
jgi:hypothetical protein